MPSAIEISASSRWGNVMSCSPTGMPELSSPTGSVSAHMPSTLPGMVLLKANRLFFLYTSGSSISVTFGGVIGTVGTAKTSTFSNFD